MPDAVYVKEAFARIADRYVMANHVLSMGMDVLWRRRVASIVAGWRVKTLLDVASGTGDLALEIQEKCAWMEIVATDFCAEMLVHAAARGMKRTEVVDALHMPYADGAVDAVTVAFGLRNMADYPAAIREMCRVTKSGGYFLILDFSLPGGVLRAPYRWYLHKILPKLAGWITQQKDAYEYLGASIEQFPSGEKMVELVEQNGYEEAACERLSCGIVSIYTARKKGK